MRHYQPATPHRKSNRRTGTILVITAVILMALVAMVGLVLDAGRLMTAHRQCQNAADAAATSAAMEMLQGSSNTTAASTATTFVQQYNEMPTATVTVNIPPASGPHSGSSDYVEAIVEYPVTTRLIQVLGGPSVRIVRARAVAGTEGVPVSAHLMALDINARPGISLSGNGSLGINGPVVVNSNGGGLNQSGQAIDNGNSGNAITTSGNGMLSALDVQSVGGVNDLSKITNYNPAILQSPLHTNSPVQSDPFEFLPIPTTATGAVATNFGTISLSGNQTVTLSPGVYDSISASANVTVTMQPGIYVIKGGGITLTGNSAVTGTGVMIYNTGSDFNVNTGLPDSGDRTSSPPASGNPTFGAISIAGNGSLRLTSYINSSSAFDGLLLYQRRLNTQAINLSGNADVASLKGTVYAKSAAISLSGNGTMNTQFVVQRLEFSGNGNMIVEPNDEHFAASVQVFLVE